MILKIIVFFLIIVIAVKVFRFLVGLGLYRGFTGSVRSEHRRPSFRSEENAGDYGKETIELDRDQYKVE